MSHRDRTATQRDDTTGRLPRAAGEGRTALAARRQPALTVAFLCCALALVVLALTRFVPEASGQGAEPALAVEAPQPVSSAWPLTEFEGFWQVVGLQQPPDARKRAPEQWVSVRLDEESPRGSVISFDGCATTMFDVRKHPDHVEMLPGASMDDRAHCGEGHDEDVLARAHRLELDGDAGLVVLGSDERALARLLRNPGGPGDSMPPEWRSSERRWTQGRSGG